LLFIFVMPKFVQTFYHIFFQFLNIFESLCQMGVGRKYSMEIPTMLGWLRITTRRVTADSQPQLGVATDSALTRSLRCSASN
jgi:hypothetical protein